MVVCTGEGKLGYVSTADNMIGRKGGRRKGVKGKEERKNIKNVREKLGSIRMPFPLLSKKRLG